MERYPVGGEETEAIVDLEEEASVNGMMVGSDCFNSGRGVQPIDQGGKGNIVISGQYGNNNGIFRGNRARGRGSFEAWGADSYSRNLVEYFHCQKETYTTAVPVAGRGRNSAAERDCI